MVFPAWDAVMVQVPEARREAVPAETVQTLKVVEAKLTGSPEEAVAVSVRVVPTACAAIGPKVMVWDSAFTVKLCSTV